MLTIYDWFGYEIPVKERYRLIKQAGFDGVLLWWSPLLNRGDYREGPQIARDQGLWVENMHTPFQVQNGIWLDHLEGEASMECYMQCIEDCAAFEIPTMVVHLPDDDKPYNALGLNRIKRLAERAEQYKVQIALENLHNLENLSSLLEQVESPFVGFCYDCCHHFHYYSEVEILKKFGPRMMAMHLHDYRDSAIHLLPFDGIIDWPSAMGRIREAGYSGATAIEAMSWGYQDCTAEEFLRLAFERGKRLEDLRL